MKKRTVYIVFNVTDGRIVAVKFSESRAVDLLKQLRSLIVSTEYRIESHVVYDYGD